MAVVYKAKCTLLNRIVAVKILKPEFLEDKKFIENFRQESQAAASMTHPNIVNIYDVGLEGKNIHYIVMEYVEGETLSSIIEREGRLSNGETIQIAKQISAALSCAHKNNIIHRDVKPHNIIVTEDGVAKITDFGIARAVTNTTLVAGDAIMGSVHYFSPEQARGGYVDGKSDLYSLGIVMYEMITGRVPFDGDNPVSVAMMHINKEITPPSYYNPGIMPELEKIILKATQKYQINRFGDAEEMLEALNSITSDDTKYSAAGAAVGITMAGRTVPEVHNYCEEPTGQTSRDTIVMDKNLNSEDSEEEYRDYLEDAPEFSGGEFGEEEYEEEPDEDELPEEEEIQNGKKTRRQKKAEKRARKAEKKASGKKRIFTSSRVFGVVIGILLAALMSMGILWAMDYITLPEVEVPDVTGMTIDAAEDALSGYGLEMEIGEQVYSSEFEAGEICAQNPLEGEKVKEGFTITVSVSKGPSAGGVPEVVGKLIDEATRLIQESGYNVGSITNEDDASPVGTVIRQTPEYGSDAEPGSVIDLVVSTGNGTEEITMINLVGASLDTAEKMLKSANLSLKNVEYKYSDTYGKGTVIEQNVAMGEKVMTGTGISVVVSKGKDPNSSSGPANTIPLVLDYTMSQNDVFEIKINMVQDGKVTLVHDQVHYKSNNGESISITGSGTATLLIYYDNNLVQEGTVDFAAGSFDN